jgi:hypothetical protein
MTTSNQYGRALEKGSRWLHQIAVDPCSFTLLASLVTAFLGSLALLAAFSASALILTLYFLKHDPQLIERRLQAGPSAEQEKSQRSFRQ